jgi:hypothetical protein
MNAWPSIYLRHGRPFIEEMATQPFLKDGQSTLLKEWPVNLTVGMATL